MSKILVLNHQSPFPVHCGNTLRVFNLCRELAKNQPYLPGGFFSDRTTRFAWSNPHADEVFTKSVPLPSIRQGVLEALSASPGRSSGQVVQPSLLGANSRNFEDFDSR